MPSSKIQTKCAQLVTNIVTNNVTNQVAKECVKTEDTGKIFEMAICIAFGIPYDGPYKYSMEAAEVIALRLVRLVELFPPCAHTAKRGARYDFTALSDDAVGLSRHLSAKTSKKAGGKVAPQVVGQSQPQKFCEELTIPFTTVEALKEYIQCNITTILTGLVEHTFDCTNLYYNEEMKTIRMIQMHTLVDWSAYEYVWTCTHETWANSSTLKIKKNDGKYIALLEVQFHTKSRSNMAVRWCYDNFLDLFRDKLDIINL